MRYLAVACLLGALACSDAVEPEHDGNVANMEVLAQSLEEAPPPPPPTVDDASYQYHEEKTFDCPLGGTVLVKVNWTLREAVYARKYYVSWEYGDCVTWQYGTIDGKVTYSQNNEDKDTFWFTGVNYFADLFYTGSRESECDAYFIMTKKTEDQIRDLSVRESCDHPVLYWWALWGTP